MKSNEVKYTEAVERNLTNAHNNPSIRRRYAGLTDGQRRHRIGMRRGETMWNLDRRLHYLLDKRND